MDRSLALRERPAGLRAGAPLARIGGPVEALGLVAGELAEAETALRQLVQTDVARVPEIAGYLLDAGGKRLRPALTALGARAIGYAGPVARLMCVGELLHLGSLLHDDVVDEAAVRRGRPAAHHLHGNAVTVLTGDFCLARAVWLAAEEGGPRAVAELGRVVTEMAEGEVLQLARMGDLDTDLQAYLDVVDRKSAALISWCVAVPAWAAGAHEAALALATFGRRVGTAFQVTDDVIDYRRGTGKDAGADLRERKVTLPLLFAFEADPGLRETLRGEADLAASMARVRRTGALERALSFAGGLVEEGIEALRILPPGRGRDALEVLGRHLVERVT